MFHTTLVFFFTPSLFGRRFRHPFIQSRVFVGRRAALPKARGWVGVQLKAGGGGHLDQGGGRDQHVLWIDDDELPGAGMHISPIRILFILPALFSLSCPGFLFV